VVLAAIMLIWLGEMKLFFVVATLWSVDCGVSLIGRDVSTGRYL